MSFPLSQRRPCGNRPAQAAESGQPACGAGGPAMRLTSPARPPARREGTAIKAPASTGVTNDQR